MKQEHSSYRTDALCRLFGRSRQAYYERSHYVATQRVEEDIILSLVRELWKDFPRMGAGKLLFYLQPQLEAKHIRMGRDAFIELLYRNFLLVRRYRNKRKTTFSNHWMHKYPNLTDGYIPSAPNNLWVSDITYIEIGDDVAYLSLITDACSHKIVGWNLSLTLSSSGALAALKMALSSLKGKYPELIHHSDRGSQYHPNPVRRVEIPKANGKKRSSGIPTIVDRVIQQAIYQVLQALYEPLFCSTSYGFRPHRSAHEALLKCGEYISSGYGFTVDMDFEQYFDTVSHSKLIEILSRTIKDGRVISLIHKYLNVGVMIDGRKEPSRGRAPWRPP